MPITLAEKQAAIAKARAAKGNGRGSGLVTLSLREVIIRAATRAGGAKGLEGYLTRQAQNQPAAFLSLLAKVLPLEVKAQTDGELRVTIRHIVEGGERDGEVLELPAARVIEDGGDKQ